jgi:nuclear protein localization family protein 4
MVDHLEFSSHSLVDRFLNAWRRTGSQRFGWLLGRYEPYDKVPMGIKAVVEAIHEPPQEGELDGLSLGLPWEDEPRVRSLASSVSSPMTIVGYIFTDLDPSEEDRTKNIYKRHPGSYFLSSLEVLFAARLQLQSPTPSRSSVTGFFSSRLVTAVATATEDGNVDISAYQVSEQASAMADADMIEASVDPGIMRIKEEDRSGDNPRYVPDVFFRYKNEYGLDVQKSAKPCFPVEYLLVNVSTLSSCCYITLTLTFSLQVTHGFPQNPVPLFRSNNFNIENRPGLEDQTIESVIRSLSKLDAPDLTDLTDSSARDKSPQKLQELVDYLSDWHLIAFLGTTQLISDVRASLREFDRISIDIDQFHFSIRNLQNDMKILAKAASSTNADNGKGFEEVFKTDSWQTLMTFTRENSRKCFLTRHPPLKFLPFVMQIHLRNSLSLPSCNLFIHLTPSGLFPIPQPINCQTRVALFELLQFANCSYISFCSCAGERNYIRFKCCAFPCRR